MAPAFVHGSLQSEVDSWIELSSQPSSSSLSSAADETVPTGLLIHQTPVTQRRRRQRQCAPSRLNVASRAGSIGAVSSQEEYEESESDDDPSLTSSGEALALPATYRQGRSASRSDDDDENRTAVNHPTNNHNNNTLFTPQPNAFSHPPSSSGRRGSQPVPGSYFPAVPERRHSNRHSYPSRNDARVQHSPFNMIAPSHNAAADHEAALRASLSTLQSFAAAARGLPKSNSRTTTTGNVPPASNRIQPNTLRMVPASALENTSVPPAATVTEPTFLPTIRRASTSTSASADILSPNSEAKRKGTSGRGSSKERRAIKKRRQSVTVSPEDMYVSPTLFTWVVSVGVVVVFSAISFSAGYSMGKEAGKFEAGMMGDGEMSACAREAGKSGLGLRRLRLAAVASSVGVGA